MSFLVLDCALFQFQYERIKNKYFVICVISDFLFIFSFSLRTFRSLKTVCFGSFVNLAFFSLVSTQTQCQEEEEKKQFVSEF